MHTFNKKGDEGETSLLFGKRISKDSPRCEAYGTVDEVVSCLGIAKNAVKKEKSRQIILELQKELFMVGSELATKPEDYEKYKSQFQCVTDEMAIRLEKQICEIESKIDLPKAFIIPGASLGSATLDLSRSIVRRAERRTVALIRTNEISNKSILHYLNRLADLLFILARYEELE